MSRLLPVYPRADLDLVRAEGSWLHTADGRRILDMYGGHAVCPLGHAHPELAATLDQGFRTLDFYSNSVRMAVQEEAAQAVLGDSDHLSRVHFVSTGTEANEAAMHLSRRMTARQRVVSFEESFHGRTLASLSATGLPAYRERLSVPLDPTEHSRIPFGDFGALSELDDSVAAVLAESVPSLGGILMPPDGYWQALEARCREVGAMLILDEVQGGVGRLGRWYAHQLFGIRPDFVTLAKSLGGGYPVGALVTTEEVASWVTPSEVGTTFGGGPLACAMVAKVAEVIRRDRLMARAEAIFHTISQALQNLNGVQVRGFGCLIGIQTPEPAKHLQAELLRRNVMTGTSNHPHTLRLMPPLTLSDEEVGYFLQAFNLVYHA